MTVSPSVAAGGSGAAKPFAGVLVEVDRPQMARAERRRPPIGEEHAEGRLAGCGQDDPGDEGVRFRPPGEVDHLAPGRTRRVGAVVGIGLRGADRGQGRNPIYRCAELAGKHEVGAGHGPAGGEDERPDADGPRAAPQVTRFQGRPQSTARPRRQPARPGHQMNGPGGAEQQETERPDPVDHPAGGAGEQVEVQILQGAHHRVLGQLAQHLGRDRVAEHGTEPAVLR